MLCATQSLFWTRKLTSINGGRSNNWQAAIKLKNGKWERFSTGTDDETDAREKALKLYYGAEAKAENKLPQSTRKFRNVAKFAIDRMQTEIEGGSGKVTYKDYIRVIENYLIPFFGRCDVANINVQLLKQYETWRDAKMGLEIEQRELTKKKKLAKKPTQAKIAKQIPKKKFKAKQSTINTHNSALNRVFDEALVHGWITGFHNAPNTETCPKSAAIYQTLLRKNLKFCELRHLFRVNQQHSITFNREVFEVPRA